MAIKEKWTSTDVSGNVSKYYESKGYEIPRRKDKKGRMKIAKGFLLNVKVDDLPLNSHKKVTRVCDNCGDELPNQLYKNIIKYRSYNGGTDNCNDCASIIRGKARFSVIPIEKSLLFNFPKLASEYHPNNIVPSDKICAVSNKVVIWMCENGHEWEASISSRTNGSKTNNGRKCSKCWFENNKGVNNPSWKGGITELNHYLRDSLSISKWKADVLKKYGFRCAITGTDGKLNIHHTVSFNQIVKNVLRELKLKVKNIGGYSSEELNKIEELIERYHQSDMGVPLLEEIHKLFHSAYGNKNNTNEQFEEFKQRYIDGEFNRISLSKIAL